VLLFPSDPHECFTMTADAFDLAERLQTPVIVLSDLDIGMNDWMCPILEWDDDYRPDRGKVLDAEALDKTARFWRYEDVDGDGIGYRSLPGAHPNGAYFVRGSGHNAAARYTEDSAEYVEIVDRLRRKWDTAATLVPRSVLTGSGRAQVGLLSIGSCDGAVREAMLRLGEEGIRADYLRVRAFPFGEDVRAFLDAHERVFVVEQNRDGQLRTLLVNEFDIDPRSLESVRCYDGLPMSWRSVSEPVQAALARGAAA
jgi:2-oxoglutarate ferredoxin oxidoreductase subunit alpha